LSSKIRRAAERQRQWRARQRNGAAVYLVPADHAVLNMLIDLGWLGENESADRREVGKAICRRGDQLVQQLHPLWRYLHVQLGHSRDMNEDLAGGVIRRRGPSTTKVQCCAKRK
jgi:hypothetical protein